MATASRSPLDEASIPAIPLIAEHSDAADGGETDTEARPDQGAKPEVDASQLRAKARDAEKAWQLCSEEQRSLVLAARWKAAHHSIADACRAVAKTKRSQTPTPLERLADHSALLYQAGSQCKGALKSMDELPHVLKGNDRVPRIYAAAEAFLDAAGHDLTLEPLLVFFATLQEDFFFQDAELSALRPCLQLVWLEQIGAIAQELLSAPKPSSEPAGDRLQRLLRSLSQMTKLDWDVVFETLSESDHILRKDPAGIYSLMDAETRQRYHRAVAELAERSDWSEVEIAREAVKLARGPHEAADPRARERRSHVGYYLIDDGQAAIRSAARYEGTLTDLVRTTLRHWPTFFYLSAIVWITCGILAAVATGAGGSISSPGRLAVILLIAFIPVTECAIAIANLSITHLLRPERLPRLDFTTGIPEEFSTLVAVPILISSEKQVRQAVKDLEIRYLGNRDRNLHFALVTDLPDSLSPVDKKDDVAGLCSSLIEELNEKYARRGAGSFIHLHRHRTYNSAEKVWMGWERKRGKMLDLNALLLQQSDRFPVKAGNLSVLSSIRYVITLDQDTQILTDSARKLIGAMAHPLNRAVVDPVNNKVIEGYAILQPRVGVSVRSARRSRLAAIFSGDSTFDVYTRAVSDVYQDLFGTGIFAGKGIYEVATFQKVLENRFPCNTILSHDLIEGAHARVGFISDIELVDDYPTHVSAYTKRKHRWVRGDWQIVLWLFPRVPESFGKLVPNTLSVISRWQILDNLRRSLSEVATFVLLLCGWMLWPKQAFFWTMTALILTASPICLDFFVSLLGAGSNLFSLSFWRNATTDLASRFSLLLCRIALLCHQSLTALDAVVRTTVRMTVTHRRLLQWETAAQAELNANNSKDLVETYLAWTVPASIALAGLLARFFPSSLWIALPFLMLWGTSKVFCDWLSMPYPILRGKIAADDQAALRHMGLRTWRFFSEFCTEEENWLIPDVVQAEPPIVAHAASTTNLGFLINAQLAARDLGFVTLSRFVTAAERTLGTISQLPTHNGHFYNWYDTHTLQPRNPRFISSVDNGNFVCCLWTIKGACAELKSEPLFSADLRLGIMAHVDAIESGLPADLRGKPIEQHLRDLRSYVDAPDFSLSQWLKSLPKMAARAGSFEREVARLAPDSEAAWWAKAICSQLRDIQEMVLDFAPWLSPEFLELHNFESLLFGLPDADELTPATVLHTLTDLHAQLNAKLDGREIKDHIRPLSVCFSEVLSRSIVAAQNMLARLSSLSALVERLADAQDFSLFYSPNKQLLSIGYDADSDRLWDVHYDLLASEARSAFFVAIAKGEAPQKLWFRPDRTMTVVDGESAMLSWTGTMFEYLLPMLWMKPFPNTLLEQAAQAAVHAHRSYAKDKLIPWGISECSCAQLGPDGRYEYRAVGVPSLALSNVSTEDVVISPYSAFLALMIDGPAAAANLRDMQERGWLGTYGFCDAYDFTPDRLRPGNSCEIVGCWMAHHQGMSMVAVANALHSNAMQRRFHAEPMVTATERLLQEAARNAPEPVGEESNKLDWLKSSVPVLRNFWQSALTDQGEEAVVPAAEGAHEARS
jgi:cyclic beta-1,2-glucan synthetase